MSALPAGRLNRNFAGIGIRGAIDAAVRAANAQGAPDVFMNILSDTGYCSRFLTDWAGPETMVKKLSIRLGVPVFPGHTLTYEGTVVGTRVEDGAGLVDIEFRAAGDLGDHVSGTAVVDLPRRDADADPGGEGTP